MRVFFPNPFFALGVLVVMVWKRYMLWLTIN